MKQLSELRDEVESWRTLDQRIHDALELAEMEDESLRAELEPEAQPLEAELDKRELPSCSAGSTTAAMPC